MSGAESVITKIQRARQHIDELDRAIDEYSRSHPYVPIHHFDSQAIEHRLRVEVQEPPLILGAIAGDVVHNLRAALDIAVYQLTPHQSRGRGTAFPFRDDPDGLIAALKSRENEGLPSSVVAYIRRLKPVDPQHGGDPLLWSINEIDISDKHKVIVPGRVVIKGGRYSATKVIDGVHTLLDYRVISPGESPELQAEVISRDPWPEMEVDIELTSDVAFVEPKIVRGDLMIPALIRRANHVERILDPLIRLMP